MSALRGVLPRPKQMLWGVLAAVIVVGALLGVAYARTTIPSPSVIASAQTTTIYASDGKTVIARVGATNRTDVTLAQVPLPVQHAVLAAEDRHFTSEPGVSPTGIVRALITDLRGGDISQGGSTITQQYVKNAYLSQQRSFTRKIKEILIASKLGQSRPKDAILTDYLNTIYFGRGAYGIQAAAQTYFHRSVSRLTVAQGALLAAVIRAPSLYDPKVDHQAARTRWTYVLGGMVKQGWLTPAHQGRLRFPKTKPSRAPAAGCTGNDCFIRDAVIHELETTDGFTSAQIALGGYNVVTTIQPKAQDALESAESGVLPTQNATQESGAVSIKPGDGAIEAMYGGSAYCSTKHDKDACLDKSGVSGLGSARPPMGAPSGSSMKVFTMLAALRSGISLDSVFQGPYEVQVGNSTIHNSSPGETCYGCTLVSALARSINTIFVPLAAQVGPKKVAAAAHDAGVPASRQFVDAPNITLGTDQLSPVDLANGYATIAAKGMRAAPYLVRSVATVGRPRTLYTAQPQTTRAFSSDLTAQAAYAMTKVLATGGTAAGRELADARPAAGKTGTTDSNSNAWFTGFTPQLCTSVWIGGVNRAKPLPTAGTGEVFGGTLPAEIWQQAMDAALSGEPVQAFPPVTGVTAPVPTTTPPPPTSSTSPTPTSPTPTPSSTSPTPTTSSSSSTAAPTPTDTGVPSSSPSLLHPGHHSSGRPSAPAADERHGSRR